MSDAKDRLAAAREARQLKAGRVAGTGGGAQHVEMFKKVLLRKNLLKGAAPGPAYVPFIGEGDIAFDLYNDRRVYGADLDPERVSKANQRLRDAECIVGDCNGWPFPAVTDQFAVADFDAYSEPYQGFRAWWAQANKADRVVCFWTDGQRMTIKRNGSYHHPDGTPVQGLDLVARRKLWNAWYSKTVKPWLADFIAPDGYRIKKASFYLRDAQLYHGAILERP